MDHRHSIATKQYRMVDPFRIERDENTHAKPTYISNVIRTSRYTWLNFLPLTLLQEFRRSANMYFLIIAILQSIKVISPLTPFTAIAPLVMVSTVSLLREALEDQKKRVSDHQTNSRPVVVVRNFEEQCILWESIEVGDILRISEREIIPADGIILSSSEEDGTCFIDTSNLDGEANLKFREPVRATLKFQFSKSDREKTKYFIKCEQPDQDLYRFSGNISIDSKMFSLSEKQLLPRGSTLMNTKWINMVVVYTGHDTKIMKNARAAHHKLSHVEIMTNKTVVVVFILEVILCAIAAIVHHVRYSKGKATKMRYLLEQDGTLMEPVLLFLSFVVLMNTLIPISLVVTVEIIKGIHAKFITWDDKMRNASGEGAIANTSSLTDELGQVKYIFTDKTGTLTQNQMEFRKCSVGGVVYGSLDKKGRPRAVSISSLDVIAREVSAVSTRDFGSSGSLAGSDLRSVTCFRTFLRDLESKESKLALSMAICHTVVCENDLASGEIKYNSDSPDECALVRGAVSMGVKLLGRNGQHIYLSLTEEGREKSYLKTVTYTLSYEILRTLHFTSDRKRMSIIVRDSERRIKLICKGADSVILDRCEQFLSSKQETMDHVTQFAVEGYRILLFAERSLEDGFYEAWESRYQEAELDMNFREEKIEALVEEIERKLTLIGSSAVEDKLQEGVPETISLFQKAGIKIWVLTGDKLETSVEMGKLCRVVTPGMREIILRGSTREEMSQRLDTALREAKDNQALIIDGSSLTYALMPANRECFLSLALRSATVIVCRTSPLQKALVVELVKTGVPYVTLAVSLSNPCSGDGANDVSMIRAAHVGVGVTGQEGMQAVRSADYAVQQFSHLGRLLLHHGRLSYIRTAQCINYFFYKNIVFTLPQIIYGALSAYSGQTFFCDLYITAYNVVFTALPVIVRAIMETDLPEKVADTFPELYRFGAMDEYFSITTVVKSGLLATFHALLLTLLPITIQSIGSLGADGKVGDLWSSSVASFFFIVPVVHFQIYFDTWNWTAFVGSSYAASITVFLVSVAVYDNVASDVEGVWGTAVVTPIFWLGFSLSTVACLLPWIAYKCYQENFVTTNPVHILRRVRFFNKILDSSQVEKLNETSQATGPRPVEN
uniref:Phospholipid-transporting ATPase n=1 Tax=Globisporangium ultimum (strain ATCC 200006 / CBS 805.95 / DAOM BR144) TaxID=431595 RepID=K3WLK8_GLOUD